MQWALATQLGKEALKTVTILILILRQGFLSWWLNTSKFAHVSWIFKPYLTPRINTIEYVWLGRIIGGVQKIKLNFQPCNTCRKENAYKVTMKYIFIFNVLRCLEFFVNHTVHVFYNPFDNSNTGSEQTNTSQLNCNLTRYIITIQKISHIVPF